MDTAREREIVGGNLLKFKKNLKQRGKLKVQFLVDSPIAEPSAVMQAALGDV